MIIKYKFFSKLTDEVSEIEVSEELGRTMVKMEKDDFNINRKETRRHCYMSELEKNGHYIADDSDLLDDILEAELHDDLILCLAFSFQLPLISSFMDIPTIEKGESELRD